MAKIEVEYSDPHRSFNPSNSIISHSDYMYYVVFDEPLKETGHALLLSTSKYCIVI